MFREKIVGKNAKYFLQQCNVSFPEMKTWQQYYNTETN